MRRTSVAALAAFVASAAFLLGQACSSFSGDNEGTDAGGVDATTADAPAIDGQAPADGSVDARDAAPLFGCAARYASGDAGVRGGGALVFCDDFEGTDLTDAGWMEPFVQGGTPAIVTASSAPNGLSGRGALALVASLDAGTLNLVSLATPNLSDAGLPLYVEFDLFPETVPGFNGDRNAGFVLATKAGGDPALQDVYVGVSAQDEINPYLLSGASGALPIGVWYHVIIGYQADKTTLDFTEKGRDAGVKGLRGSLDNTKSTSVRLGINTSGGPMTLYVDEVFIHR